MFCNKIFVVILLTEIFIENKNMLRIYYSESLEQPHGKHVLQQNDNNLTSLNFMKVKCWGENLRKSKIKLVEEGIILLFLANKSVCCG